MWFTYAFSGAFFKSLSGYYRKLSHDISSTVFSWLTSLIFVIILAPFVFFFNSPILEFFTYHWLLAIALAITSCGGLILNVKALSKDELSFVAPLNGFIPVFGLITGWIFAQEVPSITGVLCVLLIFIGTYIMALKPGKQKWYTPITHIATSRAAQLSLGTAALYALGSVASKYAFNFGYDPLTVLFVTDISGLVIFSYIFLTKKRAHIIPSIVSNWKMILASSVASFFGSVLHMYAVSLTYVGYALAIRRFDTVFSVLLGWKFLKETNIRNKLIGAGFIVFGSILLALAI